MTSSLEVPHGASLLRRVVLAYHEISELPSQDVYQLTPEQFCAQVVAALHAARNHQVEIEFTFDDAHHSHVDIAPPVLEESGKRGRFFVPAAWVGVRMGTASWADLRSLVQRGHSVGSHGNTHALLTGCDRDELKKELTYSRLTLEDKLGVEVRTISAPGGRFNSVVATACWAAGYKQIYTSKPAPATVTSLIPQAQLAITGRFAVRRQTSVQTLVSYIAGDPVTCSSLLAQYQARSALRSLIGDRTYQAAWRHLFRSPSEPRTLKS